MAMTGMSTLGHSPTYSSFIIEKLAPSQDVSGHHHHHKLRSVVIPALSSHYRLSPVGSRPTRRSNSRFTEVGHRRTFVVPCYAAGGGSGDKDGTAGFIPGSLDMRFFQSVAARLGDPLRDMLSNASRKLQDYFDSHKKNRMPEKDVKVETEESIALQEEWNWERWQKHFLHIDEKERVASVLQFELEGAVQDEDFKEASRLQAALKAAYASDPVSQVLTELDRALKEERYEDATRLRDEAAAGLVGWWVGLAEGESDPYGRIINISSSYGRFIAKAYTARQLATASHGTPLFEIFIREDDKGFHQQAVYLQWGAIGEAAPASPSPVDSNIDVNVVDMNIMTEDGKDIKTKDLTEALGEEKGKNRDATVSDEGLNGIINFLKDRIPDVKLKVFRVIAQNGEDIPKIVEQILQEVDTKEGDPMKGEIENEGDIEDILQDTKDKSGDDGELVQEVQKEIPVRLIVGGMLQNSADDKLSKAPARIQARIQPRSRDSFLLHIEDNTTQQLPAGESQPSLKVATIMTQSSGDVPPEIAKVVSNFEKIPVKVSKDMGEFLKLAVSQVQRRRGLSKCTSFERIKVSSFPDTDPLTGLYIGAFGPYTSELVQLRRKYGHWHEDNDIKEKLEFFEYVEAVKLTGDLNVPAGQVTFRAKIGKENRLLHRGIYPEELGVVARYKGQGRLAEPGFKNPQWVDGELLLLDGKGFGPLNGAELGFVYSVPERHFLVLFNRLKLQA